MSFVIPKSSYGLSNSTGPNPNRAILTLFGTLTGISIKQMVINDQISLNKYCVKNLFNRK